MKKKLLSIILALTLICTLLPTGAAWDTAARSLSGANDTAIPAETEDSTVEDNTDSPGNEDDSDEDNSDQEDTGEGEDDSEDENTLLRYDVFPYFHPTHLTEGSFSISDMINRTPSPGLLSFTKGKEKTTGKVRLKSWSISSDAVVSFVVSGAKEGDTITLPITVNSELYGSAAIEVLITIGYKELMITSDTTVTFGSTLKLTCAGMRGEGAVIYSITNGAEYASITENILTPLKVGTVTIKATQVTDGTEPTHHSQNINITIVKATPSCKPRYVTLTRAGLTLADAALSVRSSSVEGTLEWVLPEDTIAVANVAYEWIFTPYDDDNYNTVTGSVIPYIADRDFAVGEGTTVLNSDGSYTTTSYGEDDSVYELTEYPDGSLRLIHRQCDGVVITTVMDQGGTRTRTIKNPDGSSEITSELSNGIVYSTLKNKYGHMTVQISLPTSITQKADRDGSIIELPIPELPRSDNRADAPTIVFSISSRHTVRVNIPINNPGAGTVAITVEKDGEENVVRTSTTGRDSLLVTLTGSTTVKVVDISRRFNDVSRNDWFHSAAEFVTSRGLFQGMDAVTFAPHANMSRAMLVTVLHNLENNPDYGRFNLFQDADDTWYSSAATWAFYRGYINGYPDNTFRGDDNITREQLAVILYRYVGYPDTSDFINTPIYNYYDYESISSYAWDAMYWAVNSGVLYTQGGNHLAPGRDATRAEVAQTFQNLMEYLYR